MITSILRELDQGLLSKLQTSHLLGYYNAVLILKMNDFKY